MIRTRRHDRARRKAPLFGAIVLAFSFMVSACGPIQVASAVGDAEDAIEAALAAEAQINARYEYWMSVLYLEKAKRVDGRAEYEAASEFATASLNFAKAAVEEAAKEKKRQQLLQERMRARDARETP